MIMGCEQRSALHLVVHRLDDGPCDGEAVIGGRAAADLIENDETAWARLREDRGGLDHFDHERRPTTRKIVRRSDAAEQAVDDCEPNPGRRHEAAGLSEHRNESSLSKECRLAAHVRTGDQPKAIVRAHGKIVRDEALTRIAQRGLDHRVTTSLDLKAWLVDEVRPCPTVLGGAV